MAQEIYRASTTNDFCSTDIVIGEHQLRYFPREMHENLIVLDRNFFSLFPDRFRSDVALNDLKVDQKIRNEVAEYLSKIMDKDYDLAICLADKGIALRGALPNTRIISVVESYFTRKPFPNLWNVDLCGIDDTDTMNTMHDSIVNMTLSAKEQNFLNYFRENYRNLLHSDGIFSEKLNNIKPFGLLPLQHQNVSAVEMYSRHHSQMDLLIDILNHCTDNYNILATEHPQYPELSKTSYTWLRETYRNFKFFPDFFRFEGLSQGLLKYADFCVCQTSTVGVQAATIWNLPVYQASHQNRVTPFSVGCFNSNSKKLKSKLTETKSCELDKQLFFVLTRLSHSRSDLVSAKGFKRIIGNIMAGGTCIEIYANLAKSKDMLTYHRTHIEKAEKTAVGARPFKSLIHLENNPISLIGSWEAETLPSDKPRRKNDKIGWMARKWKKLKKLSKTIMVK
ncbi:hypothetical protein [Roseibium algicola]|uniref:hypothetical protein n=1 Tax=Roseibium algicola TaxID=2857014 RepID=UPI0012EB7A29|nr:hypothetical protein [Roseibium aggregatum]